MAFDFNDPEVRRSFLEQFTQSIQATVSLTQSLQSLQREVLSHSQVLGNLKTALALQKNNLNALDELVRGQGMGDSLYKTILGNNAKIKEITLWINKDEEKNKVKYQNVLAVWIAIGTAVVALLISILTSFVPKLLE